MKRDAHCHACGEALDDGEHPKTCLSCGTTIWDNPVPVSVVLVPVKRGDREGLLLIRRGIEPGKGKLALVGGFLEAHETWQVGGAREVQEETGVTVDPETLECFWFVSTDPKPNRVLLFSTSAPVEEAPAFEATSEATERGLVFGPDGLDEELAFPLHAEAARRWFAARDIEGPHGYEPWE